MNTQTEFGARVESAMKYANFTQKQLADEVTKLLKEGEKLSQQSIQHLIKKGKSSSFTTQIATACRVSANWLATGAGAMHLNEVRDDLAVYDPSDAQYFRTPPEIPLISLVKAGQWSDSVDIHEPGFADRWVESIEQNNGSCFALEVEGDSMTAPLGEAPTFPNEYIIHVNPHKQYENKSFVVAKLKHEQRVTFKQLRYNEGKPYLHALNPDPAYPDMFDKFDIIGVVYDCRPNSKWFK